MKNIFNAGLFSLQNAENKNVIKQNEKPDTEKEKHFAVVDGGQGRFAVVVEDTAEKLQKFLYSYTKNPYEIEAIGICDKNGVIQKNGVPQMTNPNKFDSQWLDNKIRNQTRTLKDMFFKGKE